jgi:hypothetical protein
MDFINIIIEYLTGRDSQADNLINEKANANYIYRDGRTAQDITTDVLNAFCNAEKNGRDFKRFLQNIVSEYG